MKNLKFVLYLFSTILTSCIQSLTETEPLNLAGAWAVVDDNDMASEFLFFERGILYEYQSVGDYYVRNDVLWGVQSLHESTPQQQYKYSLLDGVLHYYNYDEDVRIPLDVEDNVMTIGDSRCLRVNEVNESYYSRIILSEDNKLNFSCADTDVEWSYQIENPVDGFSLKVASAPWWCGGPRGVRIEDGKMYFSVQPSVGNLKDKFVFTYELSERVEVYVMVKDPEIRLDKTSATFDYNATTGSFKYDLMNDAEGILPVIECDSDWITDIREKHGRITYSVTENNSESVRTGKIILTYYSVSVEYTVTQTCARTQLVLDVLSNVLTFKAATCSFAYTVIDRVEGAEIEVHSDVDWITDLRDDGGVITYSVPVNNSGSARVGKVIVSYSDLTTEFTVSQSYSRGYSFWIGDWIFTGANRLSRNVKFSPLVADESFLLTGFFGTYDNVDILVKWDEEHLAWEISNQKLGELTVPAGWTGEAWLYGEDANGISVSLSGTPICTCVIPDDGMIIAHPHEEQLVNPNNYHYKVDNMFVVVEKGVQNQVYVLPERYSARLRFPITIKSACN